MLSSPVSLGRGPQAPELYMQPQLADNSSRHIRSPWPSGGSVCAPAAEAMEACGPGPLSNKRPARGGSSPYAELALGAPARSPPEGPRPPAPPALGGRAGRPATLAAAPKSRPLQNPAAQPRGGAPPGHQPARGLLRRVQHAGRQGVPHAQLCHKPLEPMPTDQRAEDTQWGPGDWQATANVLLENDLGTVPLTRP